MNQSKKAGKKKIKTIIPETDDYKLILEDIKNPDLWMTIGKVVPQQNRGDRSE